MLLQLLFLALWAAQGQARLVHRHQSECWYGHNKLYSDGDIVSTYQMYCTKLVCRVNRIVLEPIENCTCTEISGIDLPRAESTWQVLQADNEKGTNSRQELENREERDSEEDDYSYETLEGKESEEEDSVEDDYYYDFSSSSEEEEEEGRKWINDSEEDNGHEERPIPLNGKDVATNSNPRGVVGQPGVVLARNSEQKRQVTSLTAKQMKRRKYRCRFNGWYPRITDGTLQMLPEKCVRIVCASDNAGRISVLIQAKTFCVCK